MKAAAMSCCPGITYVAAQQERAQACSRARMACVAGNLTRVCAAHTHRLARARRDRQRVQHLALQVAPLARRARLPTSQITGCQGCTSGQKASMVGDAACLQPGMCELSTCDQHAA